MDSRTDEAVPAGWSRRVLGDVADMNPESLSASTPPDSLFGYIDLSSVEKGRIHWDMVRTEAFRSAPSRARRAVRPGDVLFGTVRPALQSHGAITPHENLPLVASTGFSVIRARQSESWPRFLFHTILGETVSRAARRMEVGSNYPAVNESDVRLFPVLCPPVPEQRHIAAILDTLDDAIRETEDLIAKHKQIERGLLHDLLTRGIDESGRLRPVLEKVPHIYRASALGMLPVDWRVGPLSDWLVGGPKNGYSALEIDEWTGTCVLGLGCLTPDAFRPRHLKSISPRDGNVQRALLHDGDLLITRSNTRELVGFVGVYREVGMRCVYPDLMMRLTPTAATSPEFLEIVLRSPASRAQLQAAASGTSGSMVKINSTVVRDLVVPMPPVAEQRRIVEANEMLAALDASERNMAQKLWALKQGLSRDLLTGRVRVPAKALA